MHKMTADLLSLVCICSKARIVKERSKTESSWTQYYVNRFFCMMCIFCADFTLCVFV